MNTYLLAYIIGGVIFFVWACYDEIKTFVGEHRGTLILYGFASLIWPVITSLFLFDFIDDSVRRIVKRFRRRS